LCSDELSLSW